MPLAIGASIAIAAWPAAAQIVTDASLGQPARALTGPAYGIAQSLGRLSGDNLFHSFQRFDIGAGESATFSTTTPGIANVISRVTGGTSSQINGRLALSAADGAPGFFFINPAGITFGAGATIDVPGAFHVGTADFVAFPDGRFHADLNQASSFSSAPPQAFGFLGGSRSALQLRDGAQLISPRGPAISLVGGDLLLDGATVGAGGGSIRLTAAGTQAGQFPFGGVLPEVGGNLTMTRSASVFSLAAGAGNGASIALQGGRIAITGDANVFSLADAGNGGAIDIRARDSLHLGAGGNVSTGTDGAGAAGVIRVRADDVLLDAGGYLYSSSSAGSSGAAGAIDVVVGQGLRLDSGASISAATAGSGQGGGIRLQAGSMHLGRQSFVQVDALSARPSGGVVLEVAGELSMADRSRVVSGTLAGADAGAVTIRAGSLTMSSASFAGSLALPGGTGAAGLVDVIVAGDARLGSTASLIASSASAGDASPIRLQAGNLLLDNARINSNAVGLTGASGNVELRLSGDLLLRNGGAIDSSTLSRGNAGTIVLRARDIVLSGDSRIASSALDSTGSAGAIDLQASGRLHLQADSTLSTSTSTAGNAGEVRIVAKSLLIESGSRITSTAATGSSGIGGNIVVTAAEELALRGQATIAANTAGSGNAGSVRLSSAAATLDDRSFVSTSTTAGSSGNAGRVDVQASDSLQLRGNSFINSDTQGLGNAGQVTLRAGRLLLESGSRISSVAGNGSRGDAGLVELLVEGDLLLLNPSAELGLSPQISTSTFATGRGGEIRIRAASILIDGPGAGIVSFAQPGSSGPAGSITVQAAGEMRIRNGGLSSSTDAAGAAGRVEVHAARVVIEGSAGGISALAGAASAGQAGSILVQAGESIDLLDGGVVSIENQATVADPSTRQPTTVRLIAPLIMLRGLAVVSAEASGNVGASDIVIDAPRGLTLDGSAISTSANAGDGGSITASTAGIALLRDSVIRTSVFGPAGDGGDIDLNAGILVLDSGFVQANTAAAQASGGRVRIAAGSLVTSGSKLFLGGNTPFTARRGIFGFNVIQAAAPTGVSGDVQLSNPVLDVTGSLRELRAATVDAGGLGRSLCQITGGSALALVGRGGMPPDAGGLLRAEPPSTNAVDWSGASPTTGTPMPLAGSPLRDGVCR
ncbi:filamentous hemagglutinin N-terminal domain-containing protein [Piscinibacter sakaiensis]|uniref:two-partner secretion domain-containing protein n=1 Tax=Piscinibacter sakaiensis TaxID=1547922 RepID=UPI003AB05A4F